MAIDLNLLCNNTLEFILPDNTSLKVKKPTQKMIIQMMALKDIEKEEPEEQLNKVISLVAVILSHNTNNRTFTEDYLTNSDLYNYDMFTAIIQEYSNFIQYIVNKNPN